MKTTTTTYSASSSPVAGGAALILLAVFWLINPEQGGQIWSVVLAPLALALSIIGILVGSKSERSPRNQMGLILSGIALILSLVGCYAAGLLLMFWGAS